MAAGLAKRRDRPLMSGFGIEAEQKGTHKRVENGRQLEQPSEIMLAIWPERQGFRKDTALSSRAGI